jgi:aryl-alcohol dehydrogenase-like predicted oxidoreductase
MSIESIESIELAPGYRIPRLIRGGWQLAGDHGAVDRERALAEMAAFIDAGLNTVDGADIYTGVEQIYGDFNSRRIAAQQSQLQVHTKFVPDYSDLNRVDTHYVRSIITRSLQRLQCKKLDLVQFHWWDYKVPGMVEAALELKQLQQDGMIAHIGGTNFDSNATRLMLNAGVPIVSMQVQYSILDRRAQNGLVALGIDRGVQLLCYGTLAGGFLTEHWLGKAEPLEGLVNRSLIKYKLIIDEFGGWSAFQELLGALKQIANKHGVKIASVATRWVLDQTGVAAAIVGARYADHLADTLSVFALKLDTQDHTLLAPILERNSGPAGDTYTLERDKTGKHGSIMKYDLNKP